MRSTATRIPGTHTKIPDTLHLYAEFPAHNPRSGHRGLIAGRAGRAIFKALTAGLYVTRKLEPVEGNSEWISPYRLRNRGARMMAKVACSQGDDISRNAASWTFDRSRMVAPEDPWVFANDCADRLADVLEPTQYWDATRQLYTSGRRFMTHLDLIGHIARQVDQVHLPSSDAALAATLAQAGTAIGWAVTGGQIPPVEFTVDERRFHAQPGSQ